MTLLSPRPWVPAHCETLVQRIATATALASSTQIGARLDQLAQDNKTIHERDCFNLNPATNVMNPRAEAMLSAGLGSRPSLGYPGDKYEMGLEAIEEIEVIAAELCAEIFAAQYAEIRVSSGAMANLYGFMALTKPGDAIIVPPASIGGHVTHHGAGCADLRLRRRHRGALTLPAAVDLRQGLHLDRARRAGHRLLPLLRDRARPGFRMAAARDQVPGLDRGDPPGQRLHRLPRGKTAALDLAPVGA